jgi:hypothetical protein
MQTESSSSTLLSYNSTGKKREREGKWSEKKNPEQVSYFLSSQFTTRKHKRKRVA